MQFDVVMTNPPFQDIQKRKKTPHKIWIDFTMLAFDRLLADGGHLLQVSPASFASPSSAVLNLMRRHHTKFVYFRDGKFFPGVASTFADYWITKASGGSHRTEILSPHGQGAVLLDESVAYLPNDVGPVSLSVHRKVMFSGREKLPVEWDYVTAHNIRRYDREPSLSVSRTPLHTFPVFHTNRSVWWSTRRQQWAEAPKVMWTRSGYTKPFYDPGELGGTDMVYFVRVANEAEGKALECNLNLKLIRYILKTARWSGFGNERVFAGLPALPVGRTLSDEEAYAMFGLTKEEQDYVERSLASRRRENA